jgi:two-component system chemotaxis response regulator CheY
MRTLIVDDSKFIREFLRLELEGLGNECMEAEDGSVALELLRRGECFDLMLVDLNMPVMNGLDCLRSMREEGLDPEMKVVMVTTEADHSTIEDALACGADEFLMKPFTVRSLQEKLMLVDLTLAV